MATVISCPFCQRSLQLPEEALSRPVKCPGCGGQFDTARTVGGTAPPAAQRPTLVVETAEVLPPPIRGVPPLPGQLRPVLVSSTHDDGPLPERREDDNHGLQRCRTCQARLTRDAAQCPACGTALQRDDDRPWEQAGGPVRRDCEPHRGSFIVALGRLALAVPGLLGLAYFPFAVTSLLAICLGLAVSIMARDDLELMRKKEMDPEGEASTMSGQTAASVGFIIGLVGLLLAMLLRLPFFFG